MKLSASQKYRALRKKAGLVEVRLWVRREDLPEFIDVAFTYKQLAEHRLKKRK